MTPFMRNDQNGQFQIESSLVVARALGMRGMEMPLMDAVSFGGDETLLESDTGESATSLRI